MKKLFALATLIGCSLTFAQDPAPAPAAPPPPPPQEKAEAAAPQGEKQGEMKRPQHGQRRAGKPGQKGNPAMRRDRMIKNQVNRINTAAETILATYDTNKDGKIDEAEKAAMLKNFEDAEKVAELARSYRRLQTFDTNGDFKVSEDEVKAKIDSMPAPGRRQGWQQGRGNGPRPGRGNGPRPGRGNGPQPQQPEN